MCWRSRWCCPTGESRCSAASSPNPPGYDLRGAFVGGEGTLGVATKIAVRLTPIPPVVRTLLLDFDERRCGRRDRERDHRRRARSRGHRDDGCPHHRRRRGVRARRLPARCRRGAHRRGRRAAGPRRRRGRAGSVDRARRTARARCESRRSDVERALLVEGPQERVRRDRAHQPRLLPPRHGGAPPQAGRGAARGLRDRRQVRPHRHERVPRGRRQPPSAARRSTGASRV